MKKLVFSVAGVIVFTFIVSSTVFAQGMMGSTETTSDGHTAREEAEGKIVWETLQTKQTTCADLTDEDFGALGEYFMGLMVGTFHEAMNNMMIRAMGEEGEKQMHIVMGKRLSGCDASAAVPSQGIGFMSMMPTMMGGGPAPFGFNQSNNMMNFGFVPFGGFGWIFMILWWGLGIAGIVALITWLTSQSRDVSRDREKSALEVLKERYAKGEIDKNEFEEKKRYL